MPLSTPRTFRPKPSHLAVCHAFSSLLDRREALNAHYRAERMVEQIAMADAFEAIARITSRFNGNLGHLGVDQSCNLTLQSNVLLMASEAKAGLSTRYSTARRLEADRIGTTPLQARLSEPITLARIVDTARFAELQEMRQDTWRLIQDFADRLTDLYYATPRITVGDLRQRLEGIMHDARGEVMTPVRVAPVAAPVPEAA